MVQRTISDIVHTQEPLTYLERQIRDDVIMNFNVVLKLVLNSVHPERFKMYGYNSCRQTAVLVGQYLKEKIPNANIYAYEAEFDDTLMGHPVKYAHCYNVIDYKDKSRKILVDVSRTTEKLLWHPFSKSNDFNPYPNFFEGYEDIKLLSKKELFIPEMLLMREPEYLTGLKPKELYDNVFVITEGFKKRTKEERDTWFSKVYSELTFIGKEIPMEWIEMLNQARKEQE